MEPGKQLCVLATSELPIRQLDSPLAPSLDDLQSYIMDSQLGLDVLGAMQMQGGSRGEELGFYILCMPAFHLNLHLKMCQVHPQSEASLVQCLRGIRLQFLLQGLRRNNYLIIKLRLDYKH